MIVFRVHEKVLYIAEVLPKSSGNPSISSIKKIEIGKNEAWEDKLYEILPEREKIGFTISDFQTYLFRFDIPSYITEEALTTTILDKAKEISATPLEELASDFSILKSTESANTILFAGTPEKALLSYMHILEKKQTRSTMIIPEIAAEYEVIKQEIEDDAVILYIELEEKTAKLSFFDKYGPFLALAEPIETKTLEKEIENAFKTIKERYNKEVRKIILGGEKGIESDPFDLKPIADIPVIKAEDVVAKAIEEYAIPLEEPKAKYGFYLGIIGAAIASAKERSLNLAKGDSSLTLLFPAKKEDPPAQVADSLTKEEIKTESSPDTASKLRFNPRIPVSKILVITVPLIILGVIGTVAFPYLQQTSNNLLSQKSEQKVVPTPVQQGNPEPSVVATPTPEAIDKTAVSIQVLNGSGKRGAAGTASKVLEEKGYTQVSAGNADTFDYEGLTIAVKKENETLASTLKKDLADDFKTITTETLDEDSKYDAIITVGK